MGLLLDTIRTSTGSAWAGNAGNRLQRKPLVSDIDMHHATCVTHLQWCMSGSLIRGDGGNVPGIPGVYATRNFTYLAKGPKSNIQFMAWHLKVQQYGWFTIRKLQRFVKSDWVLLKRVQYFKGEYKSNHYFARNLDAKAEYLSSNYYAHIYESLQYREISKERGWCTRRYWKSQSTPIAYDYFWIMDILCIGFGDSSHSIKYGHPAVQRGISSESHILLIYLILDAIEWYLFYW